MNDGEVVPSHSGIPLGGAEDASSIPVQARRYQPQSARRVQQIDPDTGTVLRVFGSAEHAARALGGKMHRISETRSCETARHTDIAGDISAAMVRLRPECRIRRGRSSRSIPIPGATYAHFRVYAGPLGRLG